MRRISFTLPSLSRRVAARLLGDEAVVALAEEVDRARGVVRRGDAKADPPRIGKHVMRLGAPGGDQLVARPLGKRDVGEVVAVQVPKLTPVETELRAAEPMRMRADALPAEQLGPD